MKIKKVAHIITKLDLGGAQENTIFSYYHHDRRRYKVYLVAGLDKDTKFNRYYDQFREDKNVYIIHKLSNSINLLNDIKGIINIYKVLKENKIDIVHTHSSKAGVLGRIAAKFAKTPVIIHTVHGWSFHNHMSKLRRKIYITIEKLCEKFTDKIITVTNLDIEKGLLEKIGDKNKYITIRSAIDFNKFESPNTKKINNIKNKYEGKKIVGTICRLSEQKNPLDFINIAKLLTNKRNDLHFIIIGDGPLRKEVEDYIDENRLDRFITLMGRKTDISDLIYVFDVFLLTSLWEGLPRVIIESMYCKIPVVANNVDGIAEIIENGLNGFTTKPHDLEEAVYKIEKILDDKNTREVFMEKAYKRVNPEFNANNMVLQIENLYEEIIKKKEEEMSKYR